MKFLLIVVTNGKPVLGVHEWYFKKNSPPPLDCTSPCHPTHSFLRFRNGFLCATWKWIAVYGGHATNSLDHTELVMTAAGPCTEEE